MSEQALIVKQRNEAVEALGEKLKEVYDDIMEETAGLEEANVMGRYRIGVHASKVTKNERNYGESAIENLSKALGGVIGSQQLWECRKIATAFSEAGIKKILSKTMPSGGKITYSHLKFIADLTPEIQVEILKATFKENLTVSELQARINAKLGGGPRGGGGRKIQPPKTVHNGLDQIVKFSDAIHKRVSVWRKAVFKKITDGPVDDITDDTVKRITETRKQVETLIEDGQEMIASLESSAARAGVVLEKRKEDALAAKKNATNGKAETNSKAETNGKATKKRTTKKKSSKSRVAAAKKKQATKKKRSAQPTPV